MNSTSAGADIVGDGPPSMPSDVTPGNFALIVGAMKSGTTSLFELLCQHPEVSGCRTKEPGYFQHESAPREGWEEYVGLWNWDPRRHKVALEASTCYAKWPWVPGVPARIASVPAAARFRFIYLMRNPVSRIESQIRHSLFEGWGKSLDEELTEDLLDFSRYAMQIDRYLEHFPRESMLLLTLDELRSDPDDVLRRTCDFLEIRSDWEFVGKERRRNTGGFYQVPPTVARLARSRPARTILDWLPRSLRRGLRSGVARLGSDREDDLGRWRLNDAEKDRVLRSLTADLRRLEDTYGVDVEELWSVPRELLTPRPPSAPLSGLCSGSELPR